jgi:hypothetical protein
LPGSIIWGGGCLETYFIANPEFSQCIYPEHVLSAKTTLDWPGDLPLAKLIAQALQCETPVVSRGIFTVLQAGKIKEKKKLKCTIHGKHECHASALDKFVPALLNSCQEHSVAASGDAVI